MNAYGLKKEAIYIKVIFRFLLVLGAEPPKQSTSRQVSFWFWLVSYSADLLYLPSHDLPPLPIPQTSLFSCSSDLPPFSIPLNSLLFLFPWTPSFSYSTDLPQLPIPLTSLLFLFRWPPFFPIPLTSLLFRFRWPFPILLLRTTSTFCSPDLPLLILLWPPPFLLCWPTPPTSLKLFKNHKEELERYILWH